MPERIALPPGTGLLWRVFIPVFRMVKRHLTAVPAFGDLVEDRSGVEQHWNVAVTLPRKWFEFTTLPKAEPFVMVYETATTGLPVRQGEAIKLRWLTRTGAVPDLDLDPDHEHRIRFATPLNPGSMKPWIVIESDHYYSHSSLGIGSAKWIVRDVEGIFRFGDTKAASAPLANLLFKFGIVAGANVYLSEQFYQMSLHSLHSSIGLRTVLNASRVSRDECDPRDLVA